MKILVLNAGSSTQKSCLYDLSDDAAPDMPATPAWEGLIDWTHQGEAAEIRVETADGKTLKKVVPTDDRAKVIADLLHTLCQGDTRVIDSFAAIDLVGHRVVHGGAEYRECTRITPAVKEAIARLAVFAPVHNPVNLEGIEAIERILGDVPQFAVFDTAFHHTLPATAYVYPGPYDWLEQGIRRYGFHGISHQYVSQRAAQLLGQPLTSLRLITCHLGNGCSVTAVREGRSVETSMGFTPLEGLMMGSRSGSIDPGILIHLLRQGHTPDDLDRVLNQESGLKGISGLSNDMRHIHAAIAAGNERAALAFDLFIHRLQTAVSGMLPSLGGLDVLVFTAGIGENDPLVWSGLCRGFEFLGLKLDPDRLQRSPDDQEISAPGSRVRVLVIHTHEDWAIAQTCLRLYSTSQGQ